MREKILQLQLGIQHFLVDAVCLACVLGLAGVKLTGTSREDYIYLFFLIAMYNSLAFCTQWLTGLCCDIVSKDKTVHAVYAFCLVLGTILCIIENYYAGIFFLGLGNSLFHVVGGRYVINHSHGKAGPLGAFVAPGALGVYIGTVWAEGLLLFCGAMVLNMIFIVLKYPEENEIMKKNENPLCVSRIILITAMVLLCIVCRAASGSVVLPGSKFPELFRWVPVLFVFAGKTLGGYIGDRMGIRLTGVFALLLGTFMFFGEWNITFLLGQFLMNLLMALTLWVLVKVLPELPGLAFGLAAAVLYPGSLIRLTWDPILVLILLSCGSIFCFWFACYLLPEKDTRTE